MNRGKKVKAKVKETPQPEKIESSSPQAPEVAGKKEKKEKKQSIKGVEELECMCCGKKLWVKESTGGLIPGCSCGLYLPGDVKCGKCALHCTCNKKGD